MTSGTTSRPRARLLALRTWLLPVVLGGAAFALHYAMHVPAGPLPPPSPAQLEADKKAADKQKREDERKQKEADRKANKAAAKADPAASPRDLPYEPFSRPRDRYLLEQLWDYYETKSFIKIEPVFEAWQTAHKPIVTQVVNATRQLALPDGPMITVGASECHTIRCRFTISAAEAEPLTRLSAALEQLKLGSDPLWHSFVAGKVIEEPSKREGVAGKQKLELTVSFIRDLPPLARMELPGKGPLRVPPPPRPTVIPPATAPSSLPPSTTPTTGAAIPGAAIPGAARPTTPARPPRAPRPGSEPDPTPK